METQTHVVLVPFIAFGHMMPFYELSLVLAKAGIRVSYVSTPRNIQRLPQLPPELLSLVTFVQIPSPSLGSNLLPEGAEATVDITADKMGHLKAAFDLLKQPLKQFVAEKSPDWIVTDAMCSWTVDVAEECHVPVVIFSPFTAAAHVFVGPPEYLVGDARKRVRSSPEDLTSPPSWVSFPSSVAFRLYEAIGFFAGLNTRNASGITDAERLVKSLGGCRAVAIRSCREFEGEYLDLFGKIIGKPAIPVGLLLPAKPDKTRIAAADDGAWIKIFEWLEEQKPKSVVFVGFGSECKLTRDQTYEIASGLESSELPFLWALRKPSWASDDLDALPPNFNRRISGRGKVCIGWAPQIEILAHPSIGGSLFHAGWGSVIETLQFGHCMVVLPQIIDQPLNARLLVEKGLAIEVKRGDDGSFNGNDIARCLRKAMISEEGDEMRAQVLFIAMSGPQCCSNAPALSSSCGEGHVEELACLKCYVSGSPDSNLAILLVSDVFGFEAPKLRKLADKVAAAGFYVVVPDFLYGDPYAPENAERPLPVWIKDHGTDKAFEDAKPVIEALKLKGVSSIGAAGFCWGAKVVVELAKYPFIQAGVLLHPSFVSLEDIQAVKVPISVLGAEIDRMSPPELLKKFDEALNAKPEVDGFVKIFPGVEHGWTVRYKDEDAGAVKSAGEAHKDMLDWLVKYVK